MTVKPEEKYEKQSDGTYKCKKCGSNILVAEIVHPVWDDDFFLCAGSGECEIEKVSYCPLCDKKPNHCGFPVQR